MSRGTVTADLPSSPRSDLSILLKVLMVFRATAITLFLGVTVIAQAVGTQVLFYAPLGVIYALIIATYGVTILFAASFNRVRNARIFAHLQIAVDLTLAALIVFLTGGFESPFPFLFLFTILWAAIALPPADCYLTASVSTILYGAILDLGYYGILLPPFAGEALFPASATPVDILGRIVLHLTAFFAVAFLGRQMSRQYRRAEEVLTERTVDLERLRRLSALVFESIGSGIMVLDPRGRIASVNAAAATILGIDRFRHLGRLAQEVFRPVPIGDLCMEALAGTVHRWEGTMVDASGRRRIMGLSLSRLRDPKAEEGGFVVIFQDLTEFRGMEDQLKRAEKLSALGRMAASIAHEIRNPLASMSGSVQLLRDSLTMEEENRRLMDIVLRETERLNNLIGDFLIYARPPSPRFSQVDLRGPVENCVRQMEVGLGGTTVFRVLLPAEPVPARVDPDQFHQVLFNLLKNAVEAMEERGEVAIHLARGKGKDGSEGALLTVSDAGRGIPADLLPEIFEPFRTTKPSGTGLGLAVAYQLVSAHGGTIEAASREGEGTSFTLFFPAEGQA